MIHSDFVICVICYDPNSAWVSHLQQSLFWFDCDRLFLILSLLPFGNFSTKRTMKLAALVPGVVLRELVESQHGRHAAIAKEANTQLLHRQIPHLLHQDVKSLQDGLIVPVTAGKISIVLSIWFLLELIHI